MCQMAIAFCSSKDSRILLARARSGHRVLAHKKITATLHPLSDIELWQQRLAPVSEARRVAVSVDLHGGHGFPR